MTSVLFCCVSELYILFTELVFMWYKVLRLNHITEKDRNCSYCVKVIVFPNVNQFSLHKP